jgi:hypothetical protein
VVADAEHPEREVMTMTVWTLSVNGELDGVFDSEEEAIEARRQYLVTGVEARRLTIMSIAQWVVR